MQIIPVPNYRTVDTVNMVKVEWEGGRDKYLHLGEWVLAQNCTTAPRLSSTPCSNTAHLRLLFFFRPTRKTKYNVQYVFRAHTNAHNARIDI